MLIQIGKLKISGAALLAIAAAYFFNAATILTAALVAAAVHESGHWAAVVISGRHVAELKLEMWGFGMQSEKPMSYGADIVTAAAGPAASLVLAVAAAMAGRYLSWQFGYYISGISAIYCVFNLLPALPLDGGKIVYAATALHAGIEKAEKISCVVSCAVIFMLLGAGAALFIKTRLNPTLLVAAVWLLISYCKRNGISIKSKRKTVGSDAWIKN